MTRAIHRLIENHAAVNGDAVAIDDNRRRVTYRELNAAANRLARRLLAAGFKHGTRAFVRMPASAELGIVLLAILKAGGCYLWAGDDGDGGSPPSIRFSEPSAAEERELHLDDIPSDARTGPNLPVVTRDTDIACLLERERDTPVAVPHATVVAMMSTHRVMDRAPWAREPGALDLWVALMSGATAVVTEQQAAAA